MKYHPLERARVFGRVASRGYALGDDQDQLRFDMCLVSLADPNDSVYQSAAISNGCAAIVATDVQTSSPH